MLVALLILIVALLATALIVREPELRRRIVAALLRGQGTVRAAFGLFSPRDLQRQALALVKESALVSIGFAHLPTDVTVRLNPQDLDRLAATREHVAAELAEQIGALDGTNAGGTVVFTLGARPQVKFAPDPNVAAGTVEVDAGWLEGTVAVTVLAATEDEAPPPPTGPRLRITVDGGAPREVVLAGRMTVGRAPACEITIDHPGVSREHAVIAVDSAQQVTVTDCDSRNRVELVGTGHIRPRTPVPIRAGDALMLGRHIRIDLVSDATEAMPSGQGRDVGD